jgi:hypothetical protein
MREDYTGSQGPQQIIALQQEEEENGKLSKHERSDVIKLP